MGLLARFALGLAALGAGAVALRADEAPIDVGVAQVDITPDYPVRLTGYVLRQVESEGVELRIKAKALAFGDPAGPAVLVNVESCAVPASLVDAVAARLEARARLPRDRFVVCSTHT